MKEIKVMWYIAFCIFIIGCIGVVFNPLFFWVIVVGLIDLIFLSLMKEVI